MADTTATLGIAFTSTGADAVNKDLRDVVGNSKNAATAVKDATEEVRKTLGPNEQWSAVERRKVESLIASNNAVRLSKEAAAAYKAELSLGVNASQSAVVAARALASAQVATGSASRAAAAAAHEFGGSLIGVSGGLQGLRGTVVGLAGSLGGLGPILRAARLGLVGLATAVGVGLITALENAGDKVEVLRNRLEGILGKGQGAAAFADLQKSADEAGRSIGNMSSIAESLVRVMSEVKSQSTGIKFVFPDTEGGIEAARKLGMGFKDLGQEIKNIQKIMAGDGLNLKQADAAFGQFASSLSGKTKIIGDDFKKLAQESPTLARAIMEALRPLQTGINTKSIDDLFNIFNDQPAKIQDVIRALANLQGAADRVRPNTSIAKAWEDLWDAIKKGEEDLQKAGKFTPITDSLNAMASAVREVTQMWRESASAGEFIEKLQNKISSLLPSLKDLALNFSFGDLVTAFEADMVKFSDSVDANIKVIGGWAQGVMSWFGQLLGPIQAYISKLLEATALKLPNAPEKGTPDSGLSDMGNAGQVPGSGLPQADQLKTQIQELGTTMGNTAVQGQNIEAELQQIQNSMSGLGPSIEAADTATDMVDNAFDALGPSATAAAGPAQQVTDALTPMGPAMSGVAGPAGEITGSFNALGPAAASAAPPVSQTSDALTGLGPAAMGAATAVQQAVAMIQAAAQSAAASAASAAASAASAASSGGGGGGGGGDIFFDIGDNAIGGMYKAPGAGAMPLKGTVHGGEVIAVIPKGAADTSLLTRLQSVVHRPAQDPTTGDIIDIGQNETGGVYKTKEGAEIKNLSPAAGELAKLWAALQKIQTGSAASQGPAASGSTSSSSARVDSSLNASNAMGTIDYSSYQILPGGGRAYLTGGGGGGASVGAIKGAGKNSLFAAQKEQTIGPQGEDADFNKAIAAAERLAGALGGRGGGGGRGGKGADTGGVPTSGEGGKSMTREEWDKAKKAQDKAIMEMNRTNHPLPVQKDNNAFQGLLKGAGGFDEAGFKELGTARDIQDLGTPARADYDSDPLAGLFDTLTSGAFDESGFGGYLPATSGAFDESGFGGYGDVNPLSGMYSQGYDEGGFGGYDNSYPGGFDNFFDEMAQYAQPDYGGGDYTNYYDPSGYDPGFDPGGYYDPYGAGSGSSGYDEGGFYNQVYDQTVSQGGGGSGYYDPYDQGGSTQGYDTGGFDFYAGDYAEGGSFTVPNKGGGRDAIKTIMNLTAGERVSVSNNKSKNSKWIGGDYEGMSGGGGENHFHFYGMTAQSAQSGPSRLAARRFVQRALGS